MGGVWADGSEKIKTANTGKERRFEVSFDSYFIFYQYLYIMNTIMLSSQLRKNVSLSLKRGAILSNMISNNQFSTKPAHLIEDTGVHMEKGLLQVRYIIDV